MINIEHLTFYYSGADKPAFHDINLRIDEGEFVLITGPSGGGKSSLCRCINGLIPHFHGGRISGSIDVNGTDALITSTKQLALKVGMVFQDPENQLVSMDVEREIAFGLENLAFPCDLIARRVEESLDTLGIAHLRNHSIHELSGGEKQKVAIASVLSLHPDILVLDEPTSELDPKGAEDVLSTIQRLNDELGITVILIEHRLDRVIHLVDRLVVIDRGKIFADGEPRQVLQSKDLESIGVGLPPIVKLAKKLDTNGISTQKIPLTIKEGRQMLGSVFQDARKTVCLQESNPVNGTVIRIDKLWHSYHANVAALKNVSLTVREGEFVAIMGRNASGKTTLAKHLNGLLKPTKGKISVNGVDTRKATTAELAHQVGLAFQNPNDHLFAETVQKEISFTLKNLGFNNGDISSRTDRTLKRFDLIKYRDQYPRSLSGGEKQRVALASVVAANPKVLILDEPTRGMEHRLKDELMQFLNEYRKKGNTVILISHDVEMVAAHTDRVILLSEGRIVVDGSVRDVLSNALLFSPQINRLFQAFRKDGIPSNILTVDEAMEAIQ